MTSKINKWEGMKNKTDQGESMKNKTDKGERMKDKTSDDIETENIETDSYETGYGKPPKNCRFPKGVSGNPLGRPKKRSDLISALTRQLDSTVIINENGKRKRIKMSDAVSKQLVNKAVSGSVQSLRLLLALAKPIEESAKLQQKKNSAKAQDLSDDELAAIILAGEKKPKE